VQASAPAHIIETAPDRDASGHVIVAKYADHLPLYPQAQIYGRQCDALDRSTLADRVGCAA